uniref:CBF1-interacting co-repressor CIR N-terminal domain-containing protein n=1 Tax=Musa acuminata subsp. malaccensis TaxID=214687 RepID=A0A804JYC9_MUSAM
MALKFLNKNGWHTGSLRNIENVWKAEQKHEAEQRKLEELRKQIQDERENSEFLLLQGQAGLVPYAPVPHLWFLGATVRVSLDWLEKKIFPLPVFGFLVLRLGVSLIYDIEVPVGTQQGLGKYLTECVKTAVHGALFEDKPRSANDAWRKLHSARLLLIRQHEQEALARIRNNPIKMTMSLSDHQQHHSSRVHSRPKHTGRDSEFSIEDQKNRGNQQAEYNRHQGEPKTTEEESSPEG